MFIVFVYGVSFFFVVLYTSKFAAALIFINCFLFFMFMFCDW